FALKEGTVSGPVAGRFGSVLVRVLKIEPEQGKPFDQVADEIRRNIGIERSKRGLLDLQNKVEDERASGQRLDQDAQKPRLNEREIAAVDRPRPGPRWPAAGPL